MSEERVKYLNQLAEIREKKGFSQLQVVAFVGIHRETLGRYERGIRLPDIITAIKLADKLGIIDLREIWGEK